MRNGSGAECGFAYVLLLVALATVGVASAASVLLGATMARGEAEEELLAIGAEYERALTSYRMATPVGQPTRNPKSLNELMQDPRYPAIKRHLRKVYPDPLTGSFTWGILREPDGSIVGIYSLGSGTPLKQRSFIGTWARFNDAKSYSRWVFGLPSEQLRPAEP